MGIGYLRPDQFLDHLTVIKTAQLKKVANGHPLHFNAMLLSVCDLCKDAGARTKWIGCQVFIVDRDSLKLDLIST